MKGQEAKELDLSKPFFEANGKKYRVSKSLSVERWRYYEDLQIMAMFGRSGDDLYKELVKAYEKLNHPKVADASVILHNTITAIKEMLDKRHHPALMICALFINAEDEDQRYYDEELMNRKIEDWQKEGYRMEDFFRVAWNLVPGFIENYKGALQGTLPGKKQKKSEVSKGKK